MQMNGWGRLSLRSHCTLLMGPGDDSAGLGSAAQAGEERSLSGPAAGCVYGPAKQNQTQ